jgi:hypothetical protein
MAYDKHDADRDSMYEKIGEELYPEHKAQAISEFTAERSEEIAKFTAELLKEAKEKAADLIALGDKRSHEIVEEAKNMAHSEGDRIINAAKANIEAEAIKQGIDLSKENVLRVLEFPPEYRQAGISILSYFSEVLKQKHPNTEAKITIEQFGTKVRLIINSPSGDVEIIERTLEEYGQVLRGELLPKQFLDNDLYALQLTNKLDLVTLELKMTKQLLSTISGLSESRISSLENEVARLHTIIGDSFSQLSSAHSAINLFFKKYNGSKDIAKALSVIESAIKSNQESLNKDEVRNALEKIHTQEPTMLSELYDILKATVTATATGAASDLYQWIIAIINAFPK